MKNYTTPRCLSEAQFYVGYRAANPVWRESLWRRILRALRGMGQ